MLVYRSSTAGPGNLAISKKKGTQINPHKLTKAEFVREEPKAFLKLGQELLARIQNLDLLAMTPLEAMNVLYQLQEDIKRRRKFVNRY